MVADTPHGEDSSHSRSLFFSSSASRFTAGASGFLNLSQSLVLDRNSNVEPNRLEAMPSSPICGCGERQD